LGFTFPELMIGLVITALVMFALTAMMSGVAQGWNANDGTQALQIQAAHANAMLNYNLASAKFIGQAGSGYAFYWVYDGWDGIYDNGPEVGEMALLKLIGTTLWLYQPISPSLMSGSDLTGAGAGLDYDNLTDPTWPTTFQELPYVNWTAVAYNVKSATFNVEWMGNGLSATERPVVEYTLVFSRSPNPDFTLYGTSLLHAPTTQPN
jgi:hypothetical protein